MSEHALGHFLQSIPSPDDLVRQMTEVYWRETRDRGIETLSDNHVECLFRAVVEVLF